MWLSVPKDLANRSTNMVLLYSVASHRSWEDFFKGGGIVNHSPATTLRGVDANRFDKLMLLIILEFCGKLCAEKRKKTKSSKDKKNPSVTSKERSPSISSSKGRSSRASSTSKLNKTTTPNGDKINYIVTSEIKT